jgi:hypothetical protein
MAVTNFSQSGINNRLKKRNSFRVGAPTTVQYLVIAGGGGGGNVNAGGGGAGGYRSSVSGENSGGGASAESPLGIVAGTSYTVTVGSGGAAETSGNNSVFGLITSTAGGRGGVAVGTAASGGSGGGGGGGGATGAAGTTGQGFAGGDGASVAAQNPGGGGGGAGQAGANGVTNQAGKGGDGVASSITGTSVFYAGGGGGGARGGGGTPVAGTGGTGGGGSGANANVSVVLSDGSVHPNSYNIIISTIADEANTLIGNTFYSNVNVIISDPANNSIENVAQSFAYANTGPVSRVEIILPGENYTSLPSLDVIANTRVRALGILGLIKVVDGGVNYQINDQIVFANTSSTGNLVLGTGARANVSNVDANGAITAVRFVANTGHIIGGTGYSDDNLPLISVLSANGTNANVVVTTTLGNGETLQAFTDSIGTIKSLLIINRGSGYTEPPTLNLTSIGDGTAQATATIITGIFTYPGRYISDDGIVSGYNFIQDRDYYQNYSYVIRTKQSLSKYRQAINELVHPAGMKLFGEFLMEDDSLVNLLDGAAADETEVIIFNTGEYESISGNVAVNRTSHELVANASVWLEFITGDGIDGKYTVTQSNANTFFVLSANTPNTSGSVSIGYMI